jgi:hypothetical protein
MIMEEWIKLYRMSWKEWSTIPAPIKLKKIGAEIVFRSLYGILGAVLMMFVGSFIISRNPAIYLHHMQYTNVRSTYYIGIIIVALLFFVLAKRIGDIFQRFKGDD